MPARRKYLVPKGLKRVRRRLAGGEHRVYWYHRATGKALQYDPETAEGLLEVLALDKRADKAKSLSGAAEATLAALWDAYRDSPEWRRLRPRTRSDYQDKRDWLGAAAEKAVVARITPLHVLKLRDKAEKERSAHYANYVVAVLRLVLEWGRVRGWCRDNAARGVKRIRKPTGSVERNRRWTDAEVATFAAEAPPHLVVPFALGLFAAMRQGDALTATWSAYDGKSLRWTASKNGEPCAAPVAGPFKAILDAARLRRGDALQIAVTSAGTPWTESGFRASFFKLVRRLTQEGRLQPHCTFHGLRHTVGALARESQQSEFNTAAAIGDRSMAMASTYGRDADRKAAQSDVLGGVQKHFRNIDWKT